MVMIVCIRVCVCFVQYFLPDILGSLVQKLGSSKIWQFIILNVLKIHITMAYISVVIVSVLTFVLLSTCFFCPAWASRMSCIAESYFTKCIDLLHCSESYHSSHLAPSPVLSQLRAHISNSCSNIFASQIMRSS